MKKLLLVLIISFGQLILGQSTMVQVKFNFPGISVYDLPNNNGDFSTDPFFDQICNANNVHPSPITNFFSFSDEYGMAKIYCPNASLSNLTNQLTSYSVIKSVKPETQDYTMADELIIQLANSNIGTYIATVNNIVTTNNTDLNSIFQTYNVDKYEGNYIRCNCNLDNLKIDLDNLSNVISQTYYATYYDLLTSSQFNKKETVISPNPFSTNFNIQTEEIISNYSLIDISGKQLINTASKNELDNASSQLNSGIYFLNLQFKNGQKGNYKLIKK